MGLFIENWSKLILRYVNNKASYGAGVWVMAVAIIKYILACAVEGAALLMKIGEKSDSRGPSRPVFERREVSSKGMTSSSNI